MPKGDVEVHPQGDSWAVKIEGEGSPRSTHQRKSDAVDSGRALAKSLQVEFVVKNQDGRIAEKDSYANDPRNVPG
jgi:Uncharacterized protein conserved in bacteria (DUF2188)